ncbi:hypothetical protein DWB84_04570 [Saccharophagus sp. K07]|jgi:hypothetical protein|uniref:hypothetical protein n=1 Tax=Saccharophagus sp. K07 TaxID=2283636 RepID=UPI001652A183|nr:hypothetical protein [Saccharophagus sp. K07]MBC6904739.1 hypothetical protein [Saccharophagus sp. K07]
MSLVSLSHLSLVRTRREMEKSFVNQDWDAVKDWDQLLAQQLTQAFDDPNHDPKMLVGEMEKILALYSDMVRRLPEATIENWLCPEQAR